MRIRYRVTIADLAELGIHQNEQMFGRRWFRISRWFGLLGGAIFLVIGWLSLFDFEHSQPYGVAPLFLFLAVIHLVTSVMLWSLRWILIGTLHRMNQDGRISGVLGDQELELTDDALILRNPFVESRIRFDAVHKMTSEGGHTFILTKLTSAYVIPHAAVTEGDAEAFVAALRAKLSEPRSAAD